MAGQLTISTLNNDTGILATQNGMNGISKAWVSFNGNGSATINSSFNVSSVVRNSTGNYTVNFTTSMPDTNFATQFTVNGSAAGGSFGNVDVPSSASFVNLSTRDRSSGNPSDEGGAYVSVFSL
jgi:hypothetical protein